MIKEHVTSGLAEALPAAIAQLDADGRIPADAAASLRRAIRDTKQTGALPVEDCLGSFEQLPPAAQTEIRRTIHSHDRWSMRGHELGWPHHALMRFLWRVRGFLERHSFPQWIKQAADVLAYGSRKGPGRLIYGLYVWYQRRAAGARVPRAGSVLLRCGLKPVDMATCYARDIVQAPAYRAYWNDPAQAFSVGVAIGIDLIPTDEGCWYIESNLDMAQRPERAQLYERDPMVHNLLQFTLEHGYKKLVVLDNNSSGIDPDMAQQYEHAAREAGLQLTLVDRVNVPSSRYLRHHGIPLPVTEETLVVRMKSYSTCMDALFSLKQVSYRALSKYKELVGDSDLLLPTTSDRPLLTDIASDDPFPNVVFKLPEIDSARGVFFMKADSPEHARDLADEALRAGSEGLETRVQRFLSARSGVYQEYIRSRLLPGRSLYIVRAHVLVTPVGVRLLSAHRVVSGRAIPDTLRSGLVLDPTPYLVNFSAGATYALVPAEETAAVERASLAVGRGLAWAAEYGFVTAPSSS